MQYFTHEYLEFFKELAANNHKEWFDTNRKRYEEIVREPFKTFVADLIKAVHKQSPEVEIEAKDAIFRINRDIRFSKDKTPYKLNNSAIISKTGRKDRSYPGLYIELGPEHLGIFGGIYTADNNQIKKIRSEILNHADKFTEIISANDFVEKFGKIKGEQHKRVPQAFKEAVELQPLIMNKQWYHNVLLPSELIIGDDLMETILDHNKTALPLKNFLINALNR
ncbi:MAG: DUF2461 domain-containing protein [Flavobacteriaceae bacterium]|nr:DUF2461 domain-containing protein [Flavobacteriaceae bacterium]